MLRRLEATKGDFEKRRVDSGKGRVREGIVLGIRRIEYH